MTRLFPRYYFAVLAAILALGLSACDPDSVDCDAPENVENAQCIDPAPPIGEGGVEDAQVIPFPQLRDVPKPGNEPVPTVPRTMRTDGRDEVYIRVHYQPTGSEDIALHVVISKNAEIEPAIESTQWINEFRAAEVGDRFRVRVSRMNTAPGTIICSIVQFDGATGTPKKRTERQVTRPNEICEVNLNVIP